MAKNNTGIEIEGFEKEQTLSADEQDTSSAEWVTPEVGTNITGKLTRAFLFENAQSKSGYQAAFEVTDKDGGKWLISERAAYRDAIRALHLGDEIVIMFKECKSFGTKGREMWEVDFYSKQADKKSRGKNILAVLKADYEKLSNATPF